MIAAGTGILIPVLAGVISGAAGQKQGKALGQQASSANLGQSIAAASTGALFFTAPSVPFLLAASMLAVSAVMVWLRKIVLYRGDIERKIFEQKKYDLSE